MQCTVYVCVCIFVVVIINSYSYFTLQGPDVVCSNKWHNCGRQMEALLPGCSLCGLIFWTSITVFNFCINSWTHWINNNKWTCEIVSAHHRVCTFVSFCWSAT